MREGKTRNIDLNRGYKEMENEDIKRWKERI
jgi:hypothetical protein